MSDERVRVSEGKHIPSTKGSLDSAVCGITEIRKLLRGLSTEEVHERLAQSEPRRLTHSSGKWLRNSVNETHLCALTGGAGHCSVGSGWTISRKSTICDLTTVDGGVYFSITRAH